MQINKRKMSFKRNLGKRKFEEAFGKDIFDDERYGNHIDVDYFSKGGVGHAVFVSLSLPENSPQNAQTQNIYHANKNTNDTTSLKT